MLLCVLFGVLVFEVVFVRLFLYVMKVVEICEKFFKFFELKGYMIVCLLSFVFGNDFMLMFMNLGMV